MNILLHGFLIYFPFPVYFSKFHLISSSSMLGHRQLDYPPRPLLPSRLSQYVMASTHVLLMLSGFFNHINPVWMSVTQFDDVPVPIVNTPARSRSYCLRLCRLRSSLWGSTFGFCFVDESRFASCRASWSWLESTWYAAFIFLDSLSVASFCDSIGNLSGWKAWLKKAKARFDLLGCSGRRETQNGIQNIGHRTELLKRIVGFYWLLRASCDCESFRAKN